RQVKKYNRSIRRGVKAKEGAGKMDEGKWGRNSTRSNSQTERAPPYSQSPGFPELVKSAVKWKKKTERENGGEKNKKVKGLQGRKPTIAYGFGVEGRETSFTTFWNSCFCCFRNRY